MLKVLEGKKTAIGAGLLALVAVAGYLGGVVNDLGAMTLIGFAMTAFGLGDKVQRFAPQILAELRELKAVQQEIASSRQLPAASSIAAEVVKMGEIAMGAAGAVPATGNPSAIADGTDNQAGSRKLEASS